MITMININNHIFKNAFMCGSNFYETDVTTTVCDLTRKKQTFKFKLN